MPATVIERPQKALLALCIAAFLVPFMGSALNLALPEISKAFHVKAVTLTWMATAYMLSTAVFQIPFARMGDLIGRKKVLILGLSGVSICTFLSGFAFSGAMIIALRAATGLCSAMMFGTNIAILSSLFPREKRGMILGINTAVVYGALSVGPYIGGVLTHFFGWRSIFFVCTAVGLTAAGLAHFFIKGEWTEAKGEKFDYLGSAVYGMALTGIITGCTLLPAVSGFILMAAGMVAFTCFVRYEQRCASPVFDVRLFSRNRVFALSSLAALINYASTSAVIFMLSLYLQYLRGFNAQHAGMIIICQAFVQTVVALFSGRLSDRFSPAWLATVGMGVIVAGIIGLIFLGMDTPVGTIIFLLLLLGIGFGIFSSPNTNVIMGSVEKKHYGQASAVTGTVRNAGQALSMGIAGMVIALQIGNQQITPAVHPQFLLSMKITFVIFAVLCTVGVFASAKRR